MSTVSAVKTEKRGQEEVLFHHLGTATTSMHPGNKKEGELFLVEYLLHTKKRGQNLNTQLSDKKK